jgi:peptide/nickel transport system substrate-binding protein
VKPVAALFASALVFALAGCGADEPDESPVAVSLTAPPDHLDPALASSDAALEPLWLVYTPLLTFRHAEGERGAELIAGLASDLPQVSSDGLTYELELRDGLKYSDGTDVEASDFEHEIERVRRLDSPGARFYDGIASVDADDETGQITITLTAPDPQFAEALALPYAAPVPASTPFKDMSGDPPPGAGPYEIASVDPQGGFTLERSSNFGDLDIPDIPTGNIAELRVAVDPSRRRQAQDVLDSKVDYMYDAPPRDLEPTITEQASDRFEVTGRPATAYFTLDKGVPPFDDPLVREAVNRGIDRSALSRAAGGLQPGCALLAPGVPGYDRELDTDGCPFGDPARPPDLGAARDLIDQAGAGGARVIVSAGDRRERRTVTAYASDLRAIGLAPRVERCAACAQTTLASAAPDFPVPEEFIDLQQPWIDDPFVSSELERLAGTELDPSSGDWKELDRYVVSPPQSYVAAFGHPIATTFFSERLDPGSAVVHPVFRNDWSSWQLKEGE